MRKMLESLCPWMNAPFTPAPTSKHPNPQTPKLPNFQTSKLPNAQTLLPAFTLVEMLVVIGIIAILMGASLAGYSKMTKSAERAKCQELVSNVSTALTALYQKEGAWPRRLASRATSKNGELDEFAAIPLATGGYFSLSHSGTKLIGADRFGILTPWAAAVVKKHGTAAAKSDPVGTVTVQDHILHYALDLEGRGVVEANVGGTTIKIRATAAVWCGGRDGVIDAYPSRRDDVYSWTQGQTQDVQ